MKSTLISLLAVAVAVAVSAPRASAQVTLSLNGDITTAGANYTLSQPVTLSLVLSTTATPTQATTGIDKWSTAASSDVPVVTSATFTDTTGTYSLAVNPTSIVDLAGVSGNWMFVQLGTQNGTGGSIGLNAPDSSAISGLFFTITLAGPTNPSTTPGSPSEFLANFVGTQAVTTQYGVIETGSNSPAAQFAFNQLVITNAGAVPEPSTYALLAGAAALGLVALRRRQNRVAAV